MINESRFWKNDIEKSILRFKKYQLLVEITEEIFVQVEKDVFWGFYSIRKLIETKTKITDALQKMSHHIAYYKHIGDPVTLLNNHKIDHLYDMKTSGSETRNVEFIANLLIHSYIFEVYANDQGGFGGILFNSDKTKDNKIYSLSASQIIKLFTMVVEDDVTHIQYTRDSETQQFAVEVS